MIETLNGAQYRLGIIKAHDLIRGRVRAGMPDGTLKKTYHVFNYKA